MTSHAPGHLPGSPSDPTCPKITAGSNFLVKYCIVVCITSSELETEVKCRVPFASPMRTVIMLHEEDKKDLHIQN